MNDKEVKAGLFVLGMALLIAFGIGYALGQMVAYNQILGG